MTCNKIRFIFSVLIFSAILLYSATGSDSSKNSIETGTALFINGEKGCSIYINNILIGETPRLVKDLAPGELKLKIESKNGIDEKTLIVKKEITEIATYNFILKEYSGSLFIATSPTGAEVYLDGKYGGKTPFVLNDVKTGLHNLNVKLEGYIELEDKLEIEKEKLLDKNYQLEKGYLVIFKNPLPEKTMIELKNNKLTVKYKINEKKFISNGEWELSIINDDLILEGVPLKIKIENNNAELDNKFNLKKSKIAFKNLMRGSKVFINNKEVTSSIKDNTFELEAGTYKLKVEKDNYESIFNNITVAGDKASEVNLIYVRKQLNFKESYKPVAIAFAVPGGFILAAGLIMSTVTLCVYNSKNFGDYSSFRISSAYYYTYKTYFGFIYAGVGIAGLGLILSCVSIPFFIIKTPRKSYFSKLSLNAQYNENISIYIKLEL